MESINQTIGWKIIRLLNYNLADARPRSFKEQEILNQLQIDLKHPLIHETRKKIREYFNKKTTLNDPILFKEIFNLSFSEKHNRLFQLNYQSSIPKPNLFSAMERELVQDITPLWTELKIQADCPTYIARTLALMFNEDEKPKNLTFYNLESFSSSLCFLLITDEIQGFSSLEDFFKKANPLLESPKKGRGLTKEEYDTIFNDPECSEQFRDLIKNSKLKKSG